MAKKKKNQKEDLLENEAPATLQPITETLEKNYMPYAMSVIVSRALPEIDGFKPSHRKLLYTMYKMGLMTGQKTKSANIVGQTMRLNPHGDASIYETMVRLTRGNESLLHPFIDSKGSFGKRFSKSMVYAASRYTEAKLDAFCSELFGGIDKNAVDFVPNYDNTMEEPTLLPTSFPNILVSPNLGIAVGMACSICSFNLAEICDGTIALLKNPKASVERIMELIKAPDFPGGASLVYDEEQMKKIYLTGTGSFKLRAKYTYDAKENCIDINEIPYTSYTDDIIKKATDMVKSGKLREVTDVRDSYDKSATKLISFDLKKDANPEIVIQKLMSATDLENSFDCNFNILIDGRPMTLGIREIILEWIRFRMKCVSRELSFELSKKEDKLHLLLGLAAIFADIDRAIRIIRNTEDEEEVVPNLSREFKITTVQAEYIAEIKLRHLNRQYILKRLTEIDELEADIKNLKDILRDDLKIKDVIIGQLREIKKKFGMPRKTEIIQKSEVVAVKKEEIFFENYNCRLVLTRGGYFKKLTMQGVRSSDEQKLKEGDYIIYEEDTDNRGDVIFVTDKRQIYRARVCDFDISRPSSMGDYVPTKLGMEDDEHVIACKMITEFNPDHEVIYIFENGKGIRIPMSCYDSKSRRKKITGAYSTASELVGAFFYTGKHFDIFIRSDMGRGILFSSEQLSKKNTRTASGTQIMQFAKKGGKIELATDRISLLGADIKKCRKTTIPSTGSIINQLTFNF